jgi:regulator of replication initiation timing
MTILCITGSSVAPLTLLSGYFAEAGLPFPAPEADAIAEELLRSVKLSHWGWAGSQSAAVLELLARSDPSVAFVLCCTLPEVSVANSILASPNCADLRQTTSDWIATHTDMLRFRHRHPERCVLVDAEDCLRNPTSFMQMCSARLGVPLHVEAVRAQAPNEIDSVALHLAAAWLERMPEARELQGEIRASQNTFGEDSDRPANPEALDLQAVSAYQQLRADFSAAATGNARLQQQLLELQAEHQKTLDQLNEARAQEEKQLAAASNVERQLNEEKKESEQLLADLHKVQEELERTFLSWEDAKRTASVLAAARDAQAKLAAERQEDIGNLSAKISALEKGLGELTSTRDTLSKDKANLVGALDAQRKAFEERETEVTSLATQKAALDKAFTELAGTRDRLAEEKAQLAKARDAQAQLAAERKVNLERLESQRSSIAQEREELSARAKDLETKLHAAQQVNARLSASLDEIAAASKASLAEKHKSAAEQKQQEDLLLVHLHQAQEDLEELFDESQNFAAHKAKLEQALEGQRQLVTEKEAEIAVLNARIAEETSVSSSWNDAERQLRAELLARVEALDDARRTLKSSLEANKNLRLENDRLARELAEREQSAQSAANDRSDQAGSIEPALESPELAFDDFIASLDAEAGSNVEREPQPGRRAAPGAAIARKAEKSAAPVTRARSKNDAAHSRKTSKKARK